MADVKKSAFSLSSATLMVGRAFVDDVFSLTPDEHSVGMTSEFSVTVDSSLNTLLNGVAQAAVDAKRTGVSSMITGNVFEMTAENFRIASALATGNATIRRGALDTIAAADDVSISVVSDPIPGEATSAITNLSEIPQGSVVLIQHPDNPDLVFPTKASGPTTGTGPFVVALAGDFAIPSNMSFPAGSKVWIIDEVPVATIDADELFCIKLTGVMTNYNRPCTFIAPKVRIARGFQVAWNETQYGSMPWEFQPFLMSQGEVASLPRLDEIGTKRPGLLYAGA